MLLPLLSVSANPANQFLAEARALTREIRRRFWIARSNRYAYYVAESGEQAVQPAYAWDMGTLLSALAAAMHHDPRQYKPLFDQAQSALRPYGCAFKGVFGYGVLPSNAPPDRYYDDNEWIALAQLDAYEASKASSYLMEAKRTFAFVLNGESSALGGGIFWRERKKTSKNTCSNAPAIYFAGRAYLETGDPKYLRIAERLHRWIERLKDPADGLMFDSIDLDGRVDRTKWSYNSALMIGADLALYRATRHEGYLKEATAMGHAAEKHWVDAATGAIDDEGPFASHLAEAFIELSRVDRSRPWNRIADRAIAYAYANAGENGLFGSRWDRFETRSRRLILLYQASMARSLWVAADY